MAESSERFPRPRAATPCRASPATLERARLRGATREHWRSQALPGLGGAFWQSASNCLDGVLDSLPGEGGHLGRQSVQGEEVTLRRLRRLGLWSLAVNPLADEDEIVRVS